MNYEETVEIEFDSDIEAWFTLDEFTSLLCGLESIGYTGYNLQNVINSFIYSLSECDYRFDQLGIKHLKENKNSFIKIVQGFIDAECSPEIVTSLFGFNAGSCFFSLMSMSSDFSKYISSFDDLLPSTIKLS